jgi:hypothetical protein
MPSPPSAAVASAPLAERAHLLERLRERFRGLSADQVTALLGTVRSGR